MGGINIQSSRFVGSIKPFVKNRSTEASRYNIPFLKIGMSGLELALAVSKTWRLGSTFLHELLAMPLFQQLGPSEPKMSEAAHHVGDMNLDKNRPRLPCWRPPKKAASCFYFI